jgi:cell wall integrity and stress response component
MIFTRFASALAAASMLLATAAAADDDDTSPTKVKTHITTPSVTLAAREQTEIGCFATGTPLENHGEYEFQSPGNCQLVCLELGKNVMGLSDGTNCWCGDEIPAKDWQIKNSTCGTTCGGIDQLTCKSLSHTTVNTY